MALNHLTLTMTKYATPISIAFLGLCIVFAPVMSNAYGERITVDMGHGWTLLAPL